ncbi:MAG: hypothetical protein ISR77_20655 [Pirellulaceae bacterium]|nr:hypothetical protein [Pirellulaceae bacterium]
MSNSTTSVALALALMALMASSGCTTSNRETPAQTLDDVASGVLSLLNHWDADQFRSIDSQPDNAERVTFYETHCFRPMNTAASGGLRFRITKTEISEEEAQVHFDILFDGKLNAPRQETDLTQPDLYDRGILLFVRLGKGWKLKEISF